MKNASTRKYGAAILSLLLLVVTVSGYGFMLAQVDGYVGRMSAALAASQSLSERDAQTRTLEAFLGETKTQRNVIDTAVITDTDVVSVIKILEDAARGSRVTLSISSVAVTQPGWAHHERVDVTLSVKGSFTRILGFTSTVEALPFATRIESGRVQRTDTGWFGTYAVTFVKAKP